MNRELALQTWGLCLRGVAKGYPDLSLTNPAVYFVKSAKEGKYDHLSDDVYDALVNDCDALARDIWCNEPLRGAGDVLMEMLSATKISEERLNHIIEILADASANTNYESVFAERERIKAYQDRISHYSSPDCTPKDIYNYIDEHIRGQEKAKKTAALLLYNHLHGRRSNTVICGPTGSGKTEMFRHLQKRYPNLIRIVDTTHISADGFKGSFHLRNIFERISTEDIKKHGLLVVMDEADKICTEAVITSGGTDHNRLIQNTMLRMLDGDTIEFGADEGNKRAFKVDCSKVSVVLLGSFENLLANKSLNSGSIGFGGETHTDFDYSNTEITYDDLIEAGLRSEIAGRISRIVCMNPLTTDDLIHIGQREVEKLSEDTGNNITIDPESLARLAEEAIEQGLGARWLKSRIGELYDDMLFDNYDISSFLLTYGQITEQKENEIYVE